MSRSMLNRCLVHAQSYSTIAQCVAILCLNSEANRPSTVGDFERQIEVCVCFFVFLGAMIVQCPHNTFMFIS